MKVRPKMRFFTVNLTKNLRFLQKTVKKCSFSKLFRYFCPDNLENQDV